jgi:hypothetical protein
LLTVDELHLPSGNEGNSNSSHNRLPVATEAYLNNNNWTSPCILYSGKCVECNLKCIMSQ